MKSGRSKTEKALSLATVVLCLCLAAITPHGAEPGGQSVLARRHNKEFKLPSGAVIIEERPLKSGGHPGRALILWMVNPTKTPSDLPLDPDFPYSCAVQTRGSYYSGPARVSLLNTKTRTVINTIKINGCEDQDSLDVPYAICKGYYYRVEGNAPKGEEVKPNILWLRDYNGDGKALEFALFNKEDCSEVGTTLIGYSERRDRVIQYPISLVSEGAYGRSTDHYPWIPNLFIEEPASPGHWKYEIDQRIRAGALNKYEVRYDAQKEMFVGKRAQIKDEREKR
jgi:hypothetical protein